MTLIALLDVETSGLEDTAVAMARLFTRARELGADLEAMIAKGLRPRALFEVADRGFDANRNEHAKAAGFRWVPERKSWERTMAIEDAAGLPFRTRQIDSGRVRGPVDESPAAREAWRREGPAAVFGGRYAVVDGDGKGNDSLTGDEDQRLP